MAVVCPPSTGRSLAAAGPRSQYRCTEVEGGLRTEWTAPGQDTSENKSGLSHNTVILKDRVGRSGRDLSLAH